MQRSLSLGFVALLGVAASSLGCSSDDDDDAANAAGSSGTTSASGGGTGGGTGSGGTSGSSGGTDTSGGASSNGDAGSGAGDTSSGDGGTSSNGNAGSGTGDTSSGGTSSGNAGDGNAGSSGAGDVVPYANVVAVSTSGSEGAYTFSVSVESADIDCTQYANWWEVLTADGTLSYRRIIDHSHTDANGTSDADKPGNTYTRTGGPVPVTADMVVLVRSHMSTGGYNGMVMRGTAAGGFTQAPDIGPDFAADVESAEPQPTSCAF